MDTLQTAIRTAQGKLSRLDAEEAILRKKLEENRADHALTISWLEMAAVFGSPEAQKETLETLLPNSSVEEFKAVEPIATSRGDHLEHVSHPAPRLYPVDALPERQPYGVWPRAVDACVEMLRGAGKPVKTRQLLEGLVNRGFKFTVGDPHGNLSNKLGRSLKVRSHPKLGWHLAEWPVMPTSLTDEERREILETIEAHVKEQPTPEMPPAAATDPFFGKTAPKVAMEVLRRNGAPMKTAEVTLAMEQRDYPFTQTDHGDAVDNALKRRVRLRGDVRRVAPGTWGLTEWYTIEELAELDTKLGLVNGIRGHSEALKQSLHRLRDRGVKLGSPARFSDEEMTAACKLVQNGKDAKAVAESLGVKVVTVNRWIQKRLANGAA